MALGSMRQRRKPFIAPRLMITSLMDMFTIILIFLLFSFSDRPENITLDANMDLPRSEAQLDHEECIRLVFTRDSLKLEDEVIATVQEGEIIGLDPQNLKASQLYKKLRKIYEDPATNLNLPLDADIARSVASGVPTSASSQSADETDVAQAAEKKKPLLFLCDKQHTFKSINQVIKTAGIAGFPNFQFAVLKK
jgi:biopolymer transport protein ExbD